MPWALKLVAASDRKQAALGILEPATGAESDGTYFAYIFMRSFPPASKLMAWRIAMRDKGTFCRLMTWAIVPIKRTQGAFVGDDPYEQRLRVIYQRKIEDMNELTKQFSRHAFHLFIFGLCLIFFSWPVLTITETNSSFWVPIAYLFIMWFFTIVLLFVVSASCRRVLAAKGSPQEEGTDKQEC